MSDVFISYARTTAAQANAAAQALRAAGYSVWLDEDLPAHRPYGREIEAQLKAAKAALVIWSAEAVESEWVLSEANRAREDRKLVQVNVDGAALPMPFDQIQCADVAGWTGDGGHAGWRKALASIAELTGGAAAVVGAPASAPAGGASPPAPLGKPSLAILPFANLSNDSVQDYFAEGMAEEIATALTHYPSLFVVGAASALRGDARGPAEIARALGVRYLLDGSVRKAGERVRITVKLTDGIDNLPIWSDRFDGTLTDIFALQDEVAGAAARKIAPNIGVAESRRAFSRPTQNMNAYDLVLRGTQSMRRNEPGDIANGLALFERAIALDPNYGAALALAAFALSLLVAFGEADPEASRRIGLEYAARALKTQHNEPETVAYAAMAEHGFGADMTVSARLLERALEHYPGVSQLWHASGWVTLGSGRPDLAQARFEEAMRLDACDADLPFNQAGLGMALVAQARFEEAVEPLAESTRLAPSNLNAPLFLALALTRLGRLANAKQALARYERPAIAAYLAQLEERNPAREALAAMLSELGVDV